MDSMEPDWLKRIQEGLGKMGSTDTAAAASPAQPAVPSRNWLADIGMILSSTAAGAKGDFGYIEKVLAERQKRALREKQQKINEEKFQLQKLALTPHLLDSLSKTSQLINDPDTAKSVAPIFQKLFKDVAGIDYPAESFQGLLLDSGKADAVKQLYPELAKELPPKQLIQLAKDPAGLDRVMKLKERQWGNDAFTTFEKLKKGGAIKHDVTLDEVNQLLPRSKYWTDEQKVSLGFDSRSTTGAKGKAEIDAAKKRLGL